MPNPNQLMERIRRIQEDRQTGALALEKDGDVVMVYFNDGLISAIRSTRPNFQLGQFIVSQGFADPAGVKMLAEEGKKKRLLIGQTALDRKVVDPQELQEVVREQVAEVLTYALKSEYEVQSFTESAPVFEASAQVDLDRLLLELARRNFAAFTPGPNQLLVLREGGDSLWHLPWFPQELSVLSLLNSPRSIPELMELSGVDYQPLLKILSVFDTLQLLTITEMASDKEAQTTSLARREAFPFEAFVPVISPAGLHKKLEIFTDEQSLVSEQFKSLKIRIAELTRNKPMRVMAVSSAQPEDGKSLVSSNLAASLSRDTGRRVVLIDCDLRNPSIHRYFGTGVEPGLLGFLRGDIQQPFCFMRRLERLYLMTAGGYSASPVEMLSMEKMKNLVDYLKEEFDTIVLDCPPFGPISDAQIISGMADGLVLVTRSGKTTYGNIEKAFRSINREKLIGVVFNDVAPQIFHTQYDYKQYRYKDRGYSRYSPKSRRSIPKKYLDY